MNSPQSFMQAACKIDYTFNWFYIDSQHIAYFNSGKNPVRAPKVRPELPDAWATTSGRGFDPSINATDQTPCSRASAGDRPAVPLELEQQAGAEVQRRRRQLRLQLGLPRRLARRAASRRGIAGSNKMTLSELINAMESGGTVDLRGAQVLPLALKVIRKTGPVDDPQLRHAIDVLTAWVSSGAYRRDADANGVYEQAEAIGIMDAWWPRLVSNEFRPTLGASLFGAIENVLPLDDPNRLHHLGSAWQDGWYGYSSKDLRTMLAKIKRLHKRGGGKHGGGHGKTRAHGGHGKKKHKSGVKGAVLADLLRRRQARGVPRGAARLAPGRAPACPTPSSTRRSTAAPRATRSGATTRSSSAPSGWSTSPTSTGSTGRPSSRSSSSSTTDSEFRDLSASRPGIAGGYGSLASKLRRWPGSRRIR